MPVWMQVGALIYFGLLFFAIAKQIEFGVNTLKRLEARLALLKPLPSELEMQETLEDEASLGHL